MARPIYYPEWATTDTTLPVAGTSNKQRPKESLRTIGWDKTQIPAAEELNWQLDNVYDWVVHFDTLNSISKTVNFIGDVSGSFSFSNNSSTIGNVSLVVADNSHNHTSSNISDATSDPTPSSIVKRDAYGGTQLEKLGITGAGSAQYPSLVLDEVADDTGLYHYGEGKIGVAADALSVGYFGSEGWNGNVTGNLTGNVIGNASTVSSVSGNISMLTGTIAHGGTIPLPSGYTESQCKWIVSTSQQYNDGDTGVNVINCFCTGRVVTTNMDGLSGTANYMIIGVK